MPPFRHPLASRFEAGPVRREHLRPLMAAAARSVPVTATIASVERVYDHDPRSFWGLSRRADNAEEPPPGVTAILLLSPAGLRQLLASTLDFADPPAAALAEPDSRPAAIYIWVMLAPGIVSGALFALFEHMNVAPFAAADIYWRPLTTGGLRLTKAFGFELATPGLSQASLYVLPRGRRIAAARNG